MLEGGPLDVLPIVDVLSQILAELQELRREIRELPSQIAAEISARL
jgi:hypothetical protein